MSSSFVILGPRSNGHRYRLSTVWQTWTWEAFWMMLLSLSKLEQSSDVVTCLQLPLALTQRELDGLASTQHFIERGTGDCDPLTDSICICSMTCRPCLAEAACAFLPPSILCAWLSGLQTLCQFSEQRRATFTRRDCRESSLSGWLGALKSCTTSAVNISFLSSHLPCCTVPDAQSCFKQQHRTCQHFEIFSEKALELPSLQMRSLFSRCRRLSSHPEDQAANLGIWPERFSCR